MVEEAEQFAEEDKKVKDRIDGRNALEGTVTTKNTLEDEEKGIADKLSEEDKETLEEAIKEALEYLMTTRKQRRKSLKKTERTRKDANPIIKGLPSRRWWRRSCTRRRRLG